MLTKPYESYRAGTMNTLRTLFLLFSGAFFAWGQGTAPAAPNCGPFNVTLTSATNTYAIPNAYAACSYWTLATVVNGFSAVSVELQDAPDSSGSPGSFVTFAGTVITGSNPTTATTQSQATFYGFYPWLRVKVNSLTGTGTIQATLYGYNTTPPQFASCQTGMGDGNNAIAAATYLDSTCYNDSGATQTLLRVRCFSDNNGTSTLNVTNGAGTALLTGAITCTTAWAAGTQSTTVTLARDDYLKFTFVADGTSKQIKAVVTQ